MKQLAFFSVVFLLIATTVAPAQTREQKVRADRKKVEAEGFWIYNDLAKGFAEAEKTGKPLLVIFRCIPCEECVKLDDDLVDRDRRLRPLLEKFVCVRCVSTNGLDLSLFQFDFDQSFAAFMFNADRTIYGRFGTRSHQKEWASDVTIDGLAKALAGALELHTQFPENKKALANKRGPELEFPSPEKYPLLRGKYKAELNYAGNVVQSCIHCHQIGDARGQLYRGQGKPIPDKVLFPYPHPKAIGLVLDPKQKATVLRVEVGSPAAKAGLQPEDAIRALNGQTLLSIADVQWVLHQAPDEATIPAQVQRGGQRVELKLQLPKGWRRRDNLSWRATTWDLRRMVTGGLVLEAVSAKEREKLGLPAKGLALRVKHVGQYGAHAAAMRAGFRKDDVVVTFDSKTEALRETDLIAYALATRKPGDEVPVTVMRAGKRIELKLPMQE